ncbi:MAG: N-succinylarginine dihydrolase, partial [Motiliproteus sp.]|nr:N-succinylarginine dihydrolase [Motiliproteus sp.]
NPRQAALQGLEKMKLLADMGLTQGFLPPHERPDLNTLRQLGFSGSDNQVLNKAAKQSPELLAACCSASSMWAANAATVSPSADCSDGRVHFSVANLQSNFHRTLESATTARVLTQAFPDPNHFVHHQALPASPQFGDEGAANHNRFCRHHGDSGIELFVYGQPGSGESRNSQRYPTRQNLLASEAIARRHGLNPKRTLFAQQNPAVIDQGVFHNDVIAVANTNLLFCHQHAFVHQAALVNQLNSLLEDGLQVIEVDDQQVDVATAVDSYLFNSQLINLKNGDMCLLVPAECDQNNKVRHYLKELVAGTNPIASYRAVDLRQSMRNGGGPACLRLRVVLTDRELSATHPTLLLNDQNYMALKSWIEQHYRDQLDETDLADPQLLLESRTALDQLTELLDLGSIYPFQQIY